MSDIELMREYCLKRVKDIEAKLIHVQITNYEEVFAIQGALSELRMMLEELRDMENKV